MVGGKNKNKIVYIQFYFDCNFEKKRKKKKKKKKRRNMVGLPEDRKIKQIWPNFTFGVPFYFPRIRSIKHEVWWGILFSGCP